PGSLVHCCRAAYAVVPTLSLHDALPIFTPGGLGPVDIVLTSTLVAVAGLTSGQAFAAVIVFRMFSFVGLVGLGWIIFLVAKLPRSEEHTSELQSRFDLVCRLLLEKKSRV